MKRGSLNVLSCKSRVRRECDSRLCRIQILGSEESDQALKDGTTTKIVNNETIKTEKEKKRSKPYEHTFTSSSAT